MTFFVWVWGELSVAAQVIRCPPCFTEKEKQISDYGLLPADGNKIYDMNIPLGRWTAGMLRTLKCWERWNSVNAGTLGTLWTLESYKCWTAVIAGTLLTQEHCERLERWKALNAGRYVHPPFKEHWNMWHLHHRRNRHRRHCQEDLHHRRPCQE